MAWRTTAVKRRRKACGWSGMSAEAFAYAKSIDLGDCENAQARLLLYVIAWNTFNDSFLCRITQEQMAYEAGRVTDRTIRRHLDALVAARFILRARPRASGGEFKAHIIRIRGFKRWYWRDHAALHKAFVKKRQPPDKLSGGSHGGGSGTPTGQIVRSSDENKVASTGQQCPVVHRTLLSGGYKETRTSKYSRTLKTPPTPSPSSAVAPAATGGKGFLEALRSEGASPHVLDGILGRLIDRGLATWKWSDDPVATARECIAAMGPLSEAEATLVCDLVATGARYRLPPVDTFAKAAARARLETSRRVDAERHAGSLPELACLAPETAAFTEALGRWATPEVIASWFTPVGIRGFRHGRIVQVVTHWRQSMLHLGADSFATAAVRSVWGAAYTPEYLRGRPVFTAQGDQP